MIRTLFISAFLFITLFSLAAQAQGTVGRPQSTAAPAMKYPRIVLYTVSWCPHCKEAVEYLTSHDIPFINRDVEQDDEAMKDLSEKYGSSAVPVIVIGKDEKVIKGFNRVKFEKALEDMNR